MSICTGGRLFAVRTNLTFASETVNLPASHPDVKRFGIKPDVGQTEGSTQEQRMEPIAMSDAATHTGSLPLQADSHPAGIVPKSNVTASATDTIETTESVPLPIVKEKPRPGPVKRKRPRQSLESMNAELNRQAAAAKKMSTFEKVSEHIAAVSTFPLIDNPYDGNTIL